MKIDPFAFGRMLSLGRMSLLSPLVPQASRTHLVVMCEILTVTPITPQARPVPTT